MNTKSDSLGTLRHELKALYRAEKHFITTLEKLQQNPHTELFKQLCQEYLQETNCHIRRLEQLGEMLNINLEKRVKAEPNKTVAANDTLEPALAAETQREQIIISFLEELI